MFDPQHLGTFHVAYANETQRQSTGTTQVPGWIEMAGIVALPRVANLRTKQFRSCDPGRAVWRQYPSPDAADGVLTVPSKCGEYSFMRHGYAGLIDSNRLRYLCK